MTDLIQISEDTWLGDIDESAWVRLLAHRGGCRCCISPPCNACSEPVQEAELNELGYTYKSPKPLKE